MRFFFSVLAGIVVLIFSGCQRSTAYNTESPVTSASSGGQKAEPKLPPARGGIPRRMEVAEVQNLLRQLGIAYASFELLNSRGPRNLEEFAPEFGRQAKIVDALKSGTWTFIYNVKRSQNPGTSILAYETQPDLTGTRIVLLCDGSVHQLDEATFNKMPKAK